MSGRTIASKQQNAEGTSLEHNRGIFYEISASPGGNAKSGTYTFLGGFVFKGTNNLPEIEAVSAELIAYVDGESGSVRIRDVSNGNTICEKTGIVNVSPGVHDMGAISNLPLEESFFEIQALNTDNDKKKTLPVNFQLFMNRP